jgi:hypothetical protein
MAAQIRARGFLSDKVFNDGQAEQIGVMDSWERRRGLTEYTVRSSYDQLVGELLELLTAVSTGKSAEYALIELADVFAFFFKYPSLVLKREGKAVLRETKETQPAVNTFLSQAILAAPVTEVPLKNATSIDAVLDLTRFLTQANGIIAGIKVNERRLSGALAEMIDILGRSQSYRTGADGTQELVKAAEKRIQQLFHRCFEQPLNGHVDMANAVAVIPDMQAALTQTAETMFGYSRLGALTASFFYEDPQAAGKNARNYPSARRVVKPDGTIVFAPPPDKKEIRKIRDQFPLSVIPPDFQIDGSETPAQYLARTYPGMNQKEIAQVVARAQIIPAHLPTSEQRAATLALR